MSTATVDSLRRVRLNLTVNLAGHVTMALAQIVFVPLYLKILGIERFGLIGLYLTLSIFLQILDMGLSTTINRQMAVQSHEYDREAPLPMLLRAFERIFASFSVTVAAAFYLAAPFVARTWLTTTLPPAEVVASLRWMGVALALQLPSGFYMAALVGREKQVVLNGVRIAMVLMLGIGAVLVTVRIAPTAAAFFTWYASGLFVQVLWLRTLVWRDLRARDHRLDPTATPTRALKHVLRFASGVATCSTVGIVFMQMDKLYVSARFPLAEFGAYSVAATVAGGLVFLVQPFYYASFPRLAALHASGDRSGLLDVYHQVCRSVANVLMPIAVTLAILPGPALFAWTGNAILARDARRTLSFLALGALALALQTLPIGLQVAWERTSHATWLAAGSVAAFGAAAIPLGERFGADGVAAGWCAVATVGAVAAGWISSRFYLRERVSRWMLGDSAMALVVSAAVAMGTRELSGPPAGRLGAAARVALAAALGMVGAFASRREVRNWVRSRLAA